MEGNEISGNENETKHVNGEHGGAPQGSNIRRFIAKSAGRMIRSQNLSQFIT